MTMKLLKADEVKVALVTGICIIAQAIILKRVLRAEADLLMSNAPVYLFIIYLMVKGSKKESKSTKPLYWSLAIVLVTALTIFRHLVQSREADFRTPDFFSEVTGIESR